MPPFGDEPPSFQPLIPGAVLENDWYPGRIPANIVVGENTVLDSSFCFKHYEATEAIGLRVGRDVTFWRTSLAVGPRGVIEVGNGCYIANASLVCTSHLRIGQFVFIAGGVTVVDSDFHPITPGARLRDTIALSPVGDRGRRPEIAAAPVVIGDDVWIGYNATILKGVRIGAGALIQPGALITRDVPPGATVAGNPARVVISAEANGANEAAQTERTLHDR